MCDRPHARRHSGDEICARRALRVGAHGHDLIAGAQEDRKHVVDVLVLQDAEQKDARLRGEIGIEPRAQCLHPGGVMRTVHDDGLPPAGEDLKARRMMHRAQRRAYGVLRDACVLARHELCRHDGECGVLRLIGPRERHLKRRRLTGDDGVEGDVLPAALRAQHLCGKVLAENKEVSAQLLRTRRDDLKRLACRRRDDGHALLDDARLVLRDPCERAAAAVGMIHRHIGDDRQLGQDDVRRVKQSAEACFNHGDLHLFLSKIEEGECRQCLKLRGMFMSLRRHGIRRRTHAREKRRKLLLADLLSPDVHALRIGDEMRREVPPGADAGRAAYSVHHLRDGALAVCPCDMNDAIAALGMSEPRTQLLHAREAEADAESIQFIQIVQ